jgi:hypothetical protein
MDRRLLNQWYEVVQIASSVFFVDEEDAIIGKFYSSAIYSF